MKFHWFNLMPWPYLPDDFRETHRSVWVDVDSRLYDPVRGHRVYNDYLDLLEYASELGFDGVGVNEHHQNAYGLMPSPQLMAATLARRTQDVSLLLLGQSIALYNPPTRVAEEMAMLDVISGGRLIAGFPVGTSMDDNYAFGANPATLREKYHEAHDLIRKAWSEPDVFAWNGRYNKLRYVNVWPRPIQNPPPIWIPGGGSIETWDFCAQHPMKPTEVLFANPSHREALLLQDRDKTEVYIQETHDLKAAAKFLWPIPDTGIRKRLPRIRAATQVVVSENDAVVPTCYGSHWQHAIHGATLITLPEGWTPCHLGST